MLGSFAVVVRLLRKTGGVARVCNSDRPVIWPDRPITVDVVFLLSLYSSSSSAFCLRKQYQRQHAKLTRTTTITITNIKVDWLLTSKGSGGIDVLV